MNVENKILERHSYEFKKEFLSLFRTYHEVTYTCIDTVNRCVHALPSNYIWHLQYWDSDLDRHLNERLKHTMSYWGAYSSEHGNTLKKLENGIKKIDMTCYDKGRFELFSVSFRTDMLLPDLFYLNKVKSAISHYATRKIRGIDGDNIALPLRAHIDSPLAHQTAGRDINYKKFKFGDISLSELELETIRYLLELKSIKEIAWLHCCSATAEKNRIIRIKEKIGCANMPLSRVFTTLKKYGIIAACLGTYIISY